MLIIRYYRSTVALYFLGKDKENGYEEEMKLKDAGFSITASNTF